MILFKDATKLCRWRRLFFLVFIFWRRINDGMGWLFFFYLKFSILDMWLRYYIFQINVFVIQLLELQSLLASSFFLAIVIDFIYLTTFWNLKNSTSKLIHLSLLMHLNDWNITRSFICYNQLNISPLYALSY